jgi:hypothetical protein
VSVSRIVTVWCDGTNGDGTGHAPDCPQHEGNGADAREARSASRFVRRPGGRDYWPACLALLGDDTPNEEPR